MYYYKEKFGKLQIEIEGVWNGDEIIYINGQLASKKKAKFKTQHDIRLAPAAEGHYILIETGLNIFLRRGCKIFLNHDPIKKNFIIPDGDKAANYWKKDGIRNLKNLEVTQAIQDLMKALKMYPGDAEAYFYLACAYSNKENAKQAFESVLKSVEHHLLDHGQIMEEGMLAYMRLHPAFESFKSSGYLNLNRDLF